MVKLTRYLFQTLKKVIVKINKERESTIYLNEHTQSDCLAKLRAV